MRPWIETYQKKEKILYWGVGYIIHSCGCVVCDGVDRSYKFISSGMHFDVSRGAFLWLFWDEMVRKSYMLTKEPKTSLMKYRS